MKTIYHYCTSETFKTILENKTLKFSDIVKSNDYNEIIYLWDKYYEYIDKIAQNRVSVSGLKYEIKNQLENMIFLAICFSEDEDALHMWNCYADGGIAIGFDVEKLKEWANRICYYNPTTYRNGMTCTEFREIKYYDNEEIEEYIAQKCKGIDFSTEKFGEVFFEAPFCKSKFFELEHELRIIIKIFTKDAYSNSLQYIDKKGKAKDVSLRSFSNKNFDNVTSATIPFFDDIDMISSITIGPNCRLNKNDIKQLLFINNIFLPDEAIHKSKGSYR